MAARLIRLPEVISRTGMSRSTIYLRLKQGNFPQPVEIGPRSIAWYSDEITDWIESRELRTRKAAG